MATPEIGPKLKACIKAYWWAGFSAAAMGLLSWMVRNWDALRVERLTDPVSVIVLACAAFIPWQAYCISRMREKEDPHNRLTMGAAVLYLVLGLLIGAAGNLVILAVALAPCYVVWLFFFRG